MNVTLKPIGKNAADLRFFILCDGQHAGGITVHSLRGTCFSYGIAVSPAMRRQGIAHMALSLLFKQMRSLGMTQAVVQIAPQNAASLALHSSLGFMPVSGDAAFAPATDAVTLSLSFSRS